MDRSSLNALTLEKAAELLATRREASRLIGGFVKRSLDLEQLKGYLSQAGDYAKGVWNAKPDSSLLSQPGGSGDYWKSVSQEALRNALIGGAGGAGLGALKGLISGDDVLGDAVTGGLTGGLLGGAGTAAYRGLDAASAPNQTQIKIDDRLNDRSPVENAKGLTQQHFGFDVDKSPTAKAVADTAEKVMPNANSDARQWGYGTHVLGGAAIGNAAGRVINRALLPHTIRQNFSAKRPAGGVPPSAAAAATATEQPSLLSSRPGMAAAKSWSLHPRKMLYRTYRPTVVPPAQFNREVQMAQGWRNRLPTGLGLVGAGIGAMEARQPAGTSHVDMFPFTPDASPQAKAMEGRLKDYAGGIRENYGHYAGEHLRSLRDAAAELPGKLPVPSDQAPMF